MRGACSHAPRLTHNVSRQLSLLDLLLVLDRTRFSSLPLRQRRRLWRRPFSRRRRHTAGIGFIDAFLEPFDGLAQPLAQLGNLAGSKNDEHDDQNEEQFHPSKRAEHVEYPLFVPVHPPRPEAKRPSLFTSKGGSTSPNGAEAIEIR